MRGEYGDRGPQSGGRCHTVALPQGGRAMFRKQILTTVEPTLPHDTAFLELRPDAMIARHPTGARRSIEDVPRSSPQ